MLTSEEIALGFKVKNLKPITVSKDQLYIGYDMKGQEIGGGKSYVNQLNNIFVNKDDIVDADQKLFYPFIWNTYLTGHGIYTDSSRTALRLDQKIAEIKKLRTDIEQYYVFPVGLAGQEWRSGVKNHIQQVRKKIELLQKNGTESALQEAQVLEDRMDKLNNMVKELQKLRSYIDFILVSNDKIAGLSYPVFKEFLKFFDQKIQTNVFLYDTCFAGARNLIYPYISKWGMPEKYHFTIVSTTISDEATTAFADIYDPFRDQSAGRELKYENIDIYMDRGKKRGKFLPVYARQDFNKFFEGLNVNKLLKEGKRVPSLQETMQYVSYPKEAFEIAQHVPGVRLPGAETFNALHLDKNTTHITKILLSQAQLKGGLTINPSKKPVVILNTYYLPVPINIPTRTMPYILPMFNKVTAQNVNAVYIQKLNTQASLVTEIPNKFLHESFVHQPGDQINSYKNPVPKMFIIDKINENTKKVMIFNKIKLPQSIQDDVELMMQDFAEHMTGILYTDKSGTFINAYAFLPGRPISGMRKIAVVDKKLTEQQIKDYHQLYETYKREIIEQAKKDNLELIPLAPIEEAIKKKVQKLQ